MAISELLILAPMEIEARAVRLALPKQDRGCVHTIGIAAARISRLMWDKPISAVILAGFAGALRPELRLGDVLIDVEPADFHHKIDLPRGRFHTATDLIATPAAKAALHAQTGACAVEMEYTIVRQYLRELNLPLIHLRVISDTAHDAVDESIMGWIDSVGRPKPWPIARSLLARPATIRTLLQLRSAISIASPRLTQAVRCVIDALEV